MFTSNKKREASKRSVHQFLCLSSFYHCLFVELPVDHFTIHTRFMLFSETIFKFPCFDLCKSITFFMVALTQHTKEKSRAKRLFRFFIARFFIVKCAFSHAIPQTFIPHTHLWQKRKFVDALSHFILFFILKRILVHTKWFEWFVVIRYEFCGEFVISTGIYFKRKT